MGLPSTVRSYAESLSWQLGAAAGPRGALRTIGVVLAGRRPGRRPPIGVPMKELGGAELIVRPGTSDLRNAADHYRLGLFLPPPGLDREPRQVLDLGSNAGASLTALAHRFPAARIVGVEPDPGNVAIARANVARFGPRCTVVESGIWDTDADLVIERNAYGEHGFSLRPVAADDPPGTPTVAATSVDTLLAEHLPGGELDYLNLTIEAAERRVFTTGGEWVERTRALRSEAHPDLGYPAEQMRTDLEALGFRTSVDPDLPDKWVFGLRA